MLFNVTATDGATDDFILSAPFMATFTIGATNGDTTNVSVMILNDDFVEGLETFDLSINNVTSTVMASVGNNDSVTITITDNDSECMECGLFWVLCSSLKSSRCLCDHCKGSSNGTY